MKTYSEKLLDPRWQKKRLEIFERDEFVCQHCFDENNTLHVHHRFYIKNKNPWEYNNDTLITLCKNCHEEETNYNNLLKNESFNILNKSLFPKKMVYEIIESFSKLEFRNTAFVSHALIELFKNEKSTFCLEDLGEKLINNK